MLIVPGYTFSDGVADDGSASHLSQFFTSCIVTGIAMSDFGAGAHVVQISATQPASDQGEGSLWFDTTLGLFRVKDDTHWDCPYVGPALQNDQGSTIKQGSAVVVSGDGTMRACLTGPYSDVVGFVTGDVANGDVGVVKQSGLTQLLIRGPCAYGEDLVTDNALPGYLRGATFYIGVLAYTGGFECAIALGSLGNTTGLITGMAWR